MAAWIVREELEHLDIVAAYQNGGGSRSSPTLRRDVEHLYLTDCPHYGDTDVPVKYFLWVKAHGLQCMREGSGYFSRSFSLAQNSRHPKNVLGVPSSAASSTRSTTDPAPGACRTPAMPNFILEASASRGHCICPHCAYTRTNTPAPEKGPMSAPAFCHRVLQPASQGGATRGVFLRNRMRKDLDTRLAESELRLEGERKHASFPMSTCSVRR